LSPFFYFKFFLNRGRVSQKKEPKILVINKGKIGDVVCTTHVFREIKKKYPRSFLGVLVSLYSKDIIKNNPYLNKIVIYRKKETGFRGFFERLKLIKEIKKEKFDWSISLGHDMTNNLIPFWAGIPKRASGFSKHSTWSAKVLSVFNSFNLYSPEDKLVYDHYLELLRFLGVKSYNRKLDIFINKQADKKAEEFLKKNNISKRDLLIGICPTTGNAIKEWMPQRWARLADKLVKNLDAKVVFIAGPSKRDKKIVFLIQKQMKEKSIGVAGVFALDEIAGFLNKLKICLTSWSATAHIADALEIPGVLIVGPCSLKSQPPMSEEIAFIYRDIYCYPCLSLWRTYRSCQEEHLRCLKEITVDEVYQTVIGLTRKEKI